MGGQFIADSFSPQSAIHQSGAQDLCGLFEIERQNHGPRPPARRAMNIEQLRALKYE